MKSLLERVRSLFERQRPAMTKEMQELLLHAHPRCC